MAEIEIIKQHGLYYECPECGAEIEEDDNYCSECGEPLEWKEN